MADKEKDLRIHFRVTDDEKAAIEAFAARYGYGTASALARLSVFATIAQVTGKPPLGGE